MSAIELFLQQQPHYLFAFVFITCLLESLAVVGLLVPGVALLASACFIAGDLDLNLAALLGAGFCGAIIGDQLSFWLGVYLRQRPHWQQGQAPWQLKLQQGLMSGDTFFQRYGVISLVLGRFIGPIRPFIPVVAGLCHMPGWQFTAINFLSALAWAPAYLIPAYYAGQALEMGLSSQQITIAVVLVLSLILGAKIWRQR